MAIVYKITNTVNGKIYIGYTKYTLDERWSGHCRAKNNTKFANAIKKYGPDAFIREILVEDEDAEKCLNYWEPFFIAQFDSTNLAKGYNSTTGGGAVFTCTLEVKAKHSANAKARWADPEKRAKLSANAKARYAAYPELRAKESAISKARWADPEKRAKLSARQKARYADPEERAKRSARQKARYAADPELRAKQSARNKARWADPEERAKQSANAKARYADPEERAKLSAGQKARWADPEERAKLSARQIEVCRKRKEQNNANSAET